MFMDQYKVVKEIGKGGYDRAVSELTAMTPEGRKRASHEAEILSSLKHTNIIR
jgi:hypothetical protein